MKIGDIVLYNTEHRLGKSDRKHYGIKKKYLRAVVVSIKTESLDHTVIIAKLLEGGKGHVGTLVYVEPNSKVIKNPSIKFTNFANTLLCESLAELRIRYDEKDKQFYKAITTTAYLTDVIRKARIVLDLIISDSESRVPESYIEQMRSILAVFNNS